MPELRAVQTTKDGGVRCACANGKACGNADGTCTCVALNADCPSTRIIQTSKNNTTTNIFSLSSITNWIAAHPYLVIGGIAFFAWLLFFRGRSRTRY